MFPDRKLRRDETGPLVSTSMIALITAQFLGSFNDNLLKIVVSLLAVDAALSLSGASAYLSLTGAVFVVPYLLFSGYAGVVADAYEKRRVLIAAKVAEVALMGLATVALAGPDLVLLLVALFLVAGQATFFSPARYGIVPELVDGPVLARANGALEAARQCGVLFGTVTGGVLLDIWVDASGAIGAVMIAIAVAGWLAASRIRRGSPPVALPRMPALPWSEAVDGVAVLRRQARLGWAVLGTTWFDLLTTVVMLDLLLVAKHTMGLDDTWVAALGGIGGLALAVGALLAGSPSLARLDVGLVPYAGIGIGVVLVALVGCTGSFGAMAGAMGFLGLFGGLYIVPLYTRLQREASPDQRGRIIATNNIFNMAGVLVGSGLLWGLVDGAGLSPVTVPLLLGLACIGFMVAALVIGRVGQDCRARCQSRLLPDGCRRRQTGIGQRLLQDDT